MESIRSRACERCGANPGAPCRDLFMADHPRGQVIGEPFLRGAHVARLDAFERSQVAPPGFVAQLRAGEPFIVTPAR